MNISDAPDSCDKFYVVGITNRDRLNQPDPAELFHEEASAYGANLAKKGLREPDVIKVPVEIYSLSSSHRELFSQYGADSNFEPQGEFYQRLYFFSKSAMAIASHFHIRVPKTLKEISRSELPTQVGVSAPPGQFVWLRTGEL